MHSILPELRDLQPGEHPFRTFKYVRQFDSMLIEPPIYLAAMLDEFRLAGGEITVREFTDLASVQQLRESLIFNCTGLGSRALFADNELIPIRGQLTFLLPQPEVDYATYPPDLYMFPRSDGILLGGTHERDNWSLAPDEAAKQRILSQHQAVFEAMRGC
jgi:glycine/D-amino acid oxidase-like deaminating enzyme